MPHRKRPLLLALGTLALAGAPLRGHDFWIEPSAYASPAGAPLALALRVGEAFAGRPVPRDPAHLARFTAHGASGELEIPGQAGLDPAGYLAGPAGAWVVAYRSHPSEITLDGATFARYLAEEGLDAVLAERERRGESGAPARERFARCAKALVRVGDAADTTVYTRRVGLPLEIVPEEDPTRPAGPGGAERPFRLLHRGAPLAGAVVVAIPADRAGERVAARSDGEGRVRLRLSGAGPWLVKSVHMVPARAGSGADWESAWASLTFEIAE